MPSEPPRRRGYGEGNPWLRTLGVIVLSASVGAIVASLVWDAKSSLGSLARSAPSLEDTRAAATPIAPACTTATPSEPNAFRKTQPETASANRSSTHETQPVSIEALPAQADRRGARGVELVSLAEVPAVRREQASTEPRARTGRSGLDTESTRSESRRDRPASAPAALPVQPSRAALIQAVGRAASAAMGCDSGPQDGKVTVTFAPSGAVQSVSLVKGFGDATVNGCVLRAFGRARVPAFSGEPVQVRKSIVW
jgi:hypothetical protein